jgi:Mrp family chromosome partitioning ATPase
VQADLVQLEKDADARRTLYTTLLQRAEQTRTDKTSPQQVGARIVDQADVPIIPSSPRPKMAAGIGLMAGVAFGGFLSLLRRRDRETYATCDELAADTGLATLVAIPRLSGRGRFGSLPDVVTSDPVSPAAEALRLLRTKLRFVGQGMVPRSLLFVSSRPGEGTSSIVAAFARLASIDGMRVLLLESDLHNPSLARLLGLPPGNGFVETLLGHEHWRDAVVPDIVSPLECLLTCNSQDNSNRLLETTQLQNLLAEAREEYNFVVLDTQPVTLGAQALVLAHLVDLVVLVVEAGVTPHENVQNALDAISATALQAPVIVLNKA